MSLLNEPVCVFHVGMPVTCDWCKGVDTGLNPAYIAGETWYVCPACFELIFGEVNLN